MIKEKDLTIRLEFELKQKIKEKAKQERTFVDELEDYFKNTPKEQIQKDWNESAEFDKVGPTVSEFIKVSKDMKSKIVEDILTRTPLKTRIEVDIQASFLNLITELGYRESKCWTEDEDPILKKLTELANKTTDYIMESINEWERDGKPI